MTSLDMVARMLPSGVESLHCRIIIQSSNWVNNNTVSTLVGHVVTGKMLYNELSSLLL